MICWLFGHKLTFKGLSYGHPKITWEGYSARPVRYHYQCSRCGVKTIEEPDKDDDY